MPPFKLYERFSRPQLNADLTGVACSDSTPCLADDAGSFHRADRGAIPSAVSPVARRASHRGLIQAGPLPSSAFCGTRSNPPSGPGCCLLPSPGYERLGPLPTPFGRSFDGAAAFTDGCDPLLCSALFPRLLTLRSARSELSFRLESATGRSGAYPGQDFHL
jgi:hypothetical protein